MTADTTKAFGPIRDDYAFFERHATEAEADLGGYADRLAAVDRGRPVRLLDFGCGPGTFSAKFLTRAAFPPERLSLSLVEPDEVYRQQAAAALAGFSRRPVEAWPALPDDRRGCFDLVVANHVFYYVPDLDATLGRLLRGLAPGGLFLTAVAGLGNPLVQFWVLAFARLGRPVPHHTAEDVEAALARLAAGFKRHRVGYELAFADNEENRMRILRFLLAEHLAGLPQEWALGLFGPHVEGGRVVIRADNEHLVVRA